MDSKAEKDQTVSRIFGMLKREGQKPVSIAEMNEAIADAACAKDQRSLIRRSGKIVAQVAVSCLTGFSYANWES